MFSLVTSFFDGVMKANDTSVAHNSHILPVILTVGCLSVIAIEESLQLDVKLSTFGRKPCCLMNLKVGGTLS